MYYSGCVHHLLANSHESSNIIFPIFTNYFSETSFPIYWFRLSRPVIWIILFSGLDDHGLILRNLLNNISPQSVCSIFRSNPSNTIQHCSWEEVGEEKGAGIPMSPMLSLSQYTNLNSTKFTEIQEKWFPENVPEWVNFEEFRHVYWLNLKLLNLLFVISSI